MITPLYQLNLGRQLPFRDACVAYTLLVLFAVPPCEAQQNERAATDLQPVRWQLLPKGIMSVCVGPDGRTWYTIDRGESKLSGAGLRTALEKEYRENSPQVAGASLALLEPSGRAWFYVTPNELWGYDGKKWIERKAVAGSNFIGVCPTQGQLLNNLANRVGGGRAWFRDEQGVHLYDGNDWTYATLCPPINSERHLPRLAVSPNGKFAAAMTPRIAGHSNNLTDADLWFWQEGNPIWKKRAIVWSQKKSTFGTFCITDEGKLWCMQGNYLRILNLAATQTVIDRLPSFLSELEKDGEARRRAFQALEEVAEQIQPQLRLAQKTIESVEVRGRLDELVKRVASFDTEQLGRGTAVGPLLVQAAAGIFDGDNGRMFIFGVATKRDEQAARGTLVGVDRAGNAQLISPNESFRLDASTSIGSHTPIMGPDGDSLWVSGTTFPGPFAHQLSLKTNQAGEQNADTNYQIVHAVDGNGRTYFSTTERNVPRTASLGVFSPDIPDPRPVLRFADYWCNSPECIVALDGKVWCAMRNGLERFDGKTWEVIYRADRDHLFPMLAGHAGVMVCRTSSVSLPREYALYQDKRLIAIAPLRKLIANHAEIFIVGFPPSYTPVQRNYRCWIATDSQRNIWLVEDYQRLAAFTGEKWIEPPQGDMRVPPGLRNGEGPRVVLAVGDGSKVYFSTGLASIRDDKMLFSEAPRCMVDVQMALGLRDREGAFWFPSRAKEVTPSKYPKGSPQYAINPPRLEHRALRLGENGPIEELPCDAWPYLIDSSGNVWLAEMGQARPRSHFWIWRDGRIVQELQVSEAQDLRALCSDKPGSVFVANSQGVHHLVAEDPQRGERFRFKGTYAFPPATVVLTQFTCPYSELAGLIIHSTGRQLCFVSLATD